MTSLALTGISTLITCSPEGTGEIGALDDAHVVVEGETIAAIGSGPPPPADEILDVGGRSVIPGFVDSHTHLVFAGDRAAEFVARMAGQPYGAGGIATTVRATRSASDDDLMGLTAMRVAEAARQGTTSLEIKSGYGLTVDDERRTLNVARSFTPDTSFLGAHVVPDEFGSDVDGYVALVTGAMMESVAPLARFVDVFCERGAFDEDHSRQVLAAGRNHGLLGKVHANQLGQGPGVRVAVESGAVSADHCTHLSNDDVDALSSSGTVATLLPATDFSTRQPYPDARRLLDAGVTVALASNCNPGSSYTSSMPFCIALAVRDMGMTIDEALWSATVGGAAALARNDVGRIARGGPADLVVLDAPSHHHLAYRPGMDLVYRTMKAGRWIGGAYDVRRTTYDD